MAVRKPYMIIGATGAACLLPMGIFEEFSVEMFWIVAINLFLFDIVTIAFVSWILIRGVQLGRHIFRRPVATMRPSFPNLVLVGLLAVVARWLVLSIPDSLTEMSSSMSEGTLAIVLGVLILFPTVVQFIYTVVVCLTKPKTFLRKSGR